MTVSTAEKAWQAPVGDTLKINVDGAFYDAQKSGGWDFVVHDRDSRVRGSGAEKISHVTSAAQSESIACEEAAKTAVEWGMMTVIMESDSKNLVRAMKSSEYDRAPEGVIYRDMRLFMLLNFNSFEFTHSPRTCNKLAHALAAYGASRQDKKLIWPEIIPNDVRVLVASNSAVSNG
jgi:ribonuclease HI